MINKPKIQHYLTLVIYLCLTLQAVAASEFKIIPLQHRFAEEILPAIKPLVGVNGTATTMQNNLIIRTSPENMAEIEKVINTLDTTRQNLKITVSRNKSSLTEQNSAEISARKRIGNVAIETGKMHNIIRNGAALDIKNHQSKSQINNSQFIQVLDGEQAFISVGQSIPYTQEWVSLTHRYIGIQYTTEFIDINTGFAVRPKSIGKQVEVEITPRFSQLNRGGVIDFDMLTTIVRTNRGEWINLGEIMQQKDDVSRAILNWKTNSQLSDNQLLILVE
jgi:type II secretory pathway component GspD/PulD (secretin)